MNCVGGGKAFSNQAFRLLILSVLGQGRALSDEGMSHPSHLRSEPLTHQQEGVTLPVQ